jgi:hypothetical protein
MQHATAQAERSVVMRAPMTFEGHGRGFKWAEQKGMTTPDDDPALINRVAA